MAKVVETDSSSRKCKVQCAESCYVIGTFTPRPMIEIKTHNIGALVCAILDSTGARFSDRSEGESPCSCAKLHREALFCGVAVYADMPMRYELGGYMICPACDQSKCRHKGVADDDTLILAT
jgi:hypothetical protein